MAKSGGWFPGKRADQIIMAKTWRGVLPDKGTAWGVPAADITELEALTTAADEALLHAAGSDRSPV
ncbi:MAG: hypothetical protein LBH70_00680, partial [Spirochaetaceae bacterium]|nr:hypothetical protein [Spirochaetaceae bacterium]